MSDVDGQLSGTQRVVLRGADVLVLNDLSLELQSEIHQLLAAHKAGPLLDEGWVAVASRPGTVEAAVKSYAGQSGSSSARPGKYKAVPSASWFVPPLVIEPSLP